MRLKKDIEEKIEDVDNAINQLIDSGNLEELDILMSKVTTLEWVLNKKQQDKN